MEPLGKGLESLIPDRQAEEISESLHIPDAPSQVAMPSEDVSTGNFAHARSYQDHFTPRRVESVFWIEVEKIEPNPYQPRREFAEEALKDLASSIREHGVIQPIIVTKREIETTTGLEVNYQLIAGERRLRAAQLAGLSQIPAIIRRGVPDDRIKLELALIENLQREDLNAIERAKAYKQLIDEFHLVQREVGNRVGKSRETVTNTLRLLSLTPELQEAIISGKMTDGHGRAILMIGDDVPKQLELYNEIISDDLSVRAAENRARQISGRTLTPSPRASRLTDPELQNWQSQLQEKFGTRVHLQKRGERGKIVVEFYSDEEMRGILNKMIKEA